MPPYIELEAASNFSFLEGASHPRELVEQAQALGHAGLALADRNTLAGVVRAYQRAKHLKDEGIAFQFIVGSRLVLRDGFQVLCFPTDRAAYGRLSKLLTLGQRRAVKGGCLLDPPDVLAQGEGQIFVASQPERPDEAHAATVAMLARAFPGNVYQAATWRYDGDDRRRLAQLARLMQPAGVPLVATNDVRYHVAGRRPLQDVLSCIRLKTTVAEAGTQLASNAERYLKTPAEMARLFRDYPEAVARSREIAARCRFSLGDLRYEYPHEVTEEGRTPDEELAYRTWKGADGRYPQGVPQKIRDNLLKELDLVRTQNYAPFFLTVDDIVRYARSKEILCQGRGSAANSSICYCLGITAVDPAVRDLLFARFLSTARGEPPDIDVDFEHERREEVIQYIYGKYGRHRAGIAATVISYRGRSALREVTKAMGLSPDVVEVLNRTAWRAYDEEGAQEKIDTAAVAKVGLDLRDPVLVRTLELARELMGFPRHLSQHVGGFVIARDSLEELVPILNGAMPDRTFIEWDKEDLGSLGMLKVDVLGLGMLTCLRIAFDLLSRHKSLPLTVGSVPQDDPAVYGMLQKGDSLGVFQVESRGQMAMLPRLKPKEFYDLVIEVAIVRPGPIQGNMVHPYLRRREGVEQVTYPSPALRAVLEKTKGVPLFQEQAMQIAIIGAGFTDAEADHLRRSMASFQRNGRIGEFRSKFVDGMVKNGYEREYAQRCFKQIEGFSTYGFPESHAASFAILVYVSAWIKCHHPEVFACALLNAQPLGFYQPAQIIRDAAEHGAEVRPVDVNASGWDCTLEPTGDGRCALRLGLRQIAGMSEEEVVGKLMAARGSGYTGVRDLWLRSGLTVASIEKLAAADTFRSLGVQRREALWAVKGLGDAPLPLFMAAERGAALQSEPRMTLPALGLGAEVAQDYMTTALSLKRHPLAMIRPRLHAAGWNQAGLLDDAPQGQRVRVAGLVLVRQHPESANGIVFVTLEDEGGIANLVLYPDVFEAFRPVAMGARLLACEGTVDRKEIVVHVRALSLFDLSGWLQDLVMDDGAPPPLDPYARTLARAEEMRRPGRGRRSQIEVRSRDFH